MKVTLSVVAGPGTGMRKVFDEPEFFLVGRHLNCHYSLLDDPFLSRHHFLMEISPPDILLRDLGSLNGTFINGIKHGGRIQGETQEEAKERQSVIRLKDGDLVKVGKTEIKVAMEAPAIQPWDVDTLPAMQQPGGVDEQPVDEGKPGPCLPRKEDDSFLKNLLQDETWSA